MRDLAQDVRYAWRMLMKSPGFTLVVLLTLGLGIGANTAIFSVMNAVLLRPLPYAQAGQIASITRMRAETGESNESWSYPDFRDLQKENRTLEQVAIYAPDTATLTGNGEARHVQINKSSPDLFPLLRVTPVVGRTFVAGEDAPGHFVAMLTYATWQSHFGGNTGVVGRSIVLDGANYTVVGVLPASFEFPFFNGEPEIWVTYSRDATPNPPGSKTMTEERGASMSQAIARLRDGVSYAAASADVAAVSEGLAKEYPDTNKYWVFKLKPAIESLAGGMRAQFYILLGAVMLVLLIACANVANLMLAKTAGREREIGIRYAMGATRGRLVRQFLIESLMLSFGGGVLGLLLASWIEAVIRGFNGGGHIPRIAEASLDGRVLIFSLAMVMATAFLFGLAPALQASGRRVAESLKEGGRATSQSQRQIKIKNALVTTEMIFAVMLLTAAGLLMKSLEKLENVNPGFVARGVTTFKVSVPYPDTERTVNYFNSLFAELKGVPGVEAVSGVTPLPLSGDNLATSYQIEGRPVPRADEPVAMFRAIGADYFKTMEIPLQQGRFFTDADQLKSTPVVIINRKLAEMAFPGENPIGKKIKPGVSTDGNALMREIVGVVGPVKHRALTRDEEPSCYLAESQIGFPTLSVVMRTSEAFTGIGSATGTGAKGAEMGGGAGLMSMVRDRARSINKDVPIYDVKSMEQYVNESIEAPRLDTELLGCFATLAVILAVVGIYGVMSYGVSQRTGEIGIRMTLGAQRGDVMRMVLSQGLRVAAIGVGIGAAAALWTNRLLGSLLFGVRPGDAGIFVAVIVVLVGSALAACYVPARRAMRVSPMEALRYE